MHSILHTAFKWQCARDNWEISFHTMYMYRLVYSYILLVRRDGKFFFFFFWAYWRNRERCSWSFHECGTKKEFWVPTRNWTSDLQIPCSEALPISQRDSMMSKGHCEACTWHSSCILQGTAVLCPNSVMFAHRTRKMVNFELGK